MRSHPVLPSLATLPAVEPQEETTVRHVPPYHVILENDDQHSMGFVIEVLSQVIGCPVEHAALLMWEAHTQGRAIVWTGPKEVAELKAEQIQSFHEKPFGPLGCTIEPAPGG